MLLFEQMWNSEGKRISELTAMRELRNGAYVVAENQQYRLVRVSLMGGRPTLHHSGMDREQECAYRGTSGLYV